jgi:hypothetical protein
MSNSQQKNGNWATLTAKIDRNCARTPPTKPQVEEIPNKTIAFFVILSGAVGHRNIPNAIPPENGHSSEIALGAF